MINLYKLFFSPFFGGHCRFIPTCSDYAIEAIKFLPLHRAIFSIIYRILRCNPFSKGGYDPVKHKTVL